MTNKGSEFATNIADKYGPALTKAFIDGDLSEFKSLFVSDPVEVVLQNSEGSELEFTVSDKDDATLSWEEFHTAAVKDIKEQDYGKTESDCVGVLGNRMILHAGRFNKGGEVYNEAYSIVTFNNEGKILALESFSDPKFSNLIETVKS